ncbi:HAD-superfamily hydrolase, subfamily IA, variant 3 [Beutenbergia cavernae DSM 12333]|uniref:HAD-superfamily hydrolase, subfamily IA, variant 3 n=1 Tax=Beutenbergia cavernae (strain ATCC BAA-8 / DSM 12333 / CCUG 43141 / JCM 11478 / NBRC 16432 / NCIMB 13614 / HKI 0122) TaxID=471853 RepID=C5C696_BEUC1|nr:HAD family phosphatase [Beutenbergia cavernae]ACQ80302.1 HAD-superfamily hydrolase, subfamily IA, variant 3 [Beutenbergia cavernae DSM 12333]
MTLAPEPGSIDAVVFDLGNVVVHWDPVPAFADLGSPAEIEEFFAEVDFTALNHARDAGAPWAEAAADVTARFPHRAGWVEAYVDNFPRTLTGLVPGTSDVVREVKATGIRVLGLTNWSAETFHHAPAAAPVLAELEGILVSGEVGVAKPDPAIFDELVRRFGLVPERTAFTDDSPANVAAARASGLHGLLFTDAATLRRDLRAVGVPVAAS